MTLTVAAGGIDLSVGTAVDFSSLAFVFLVLGGHAVWLSALAGLGAGLAVGLFNAFLITRLGITPFLATLGTLFIGHSGQQLLTRQPSVYPTCCPPAVIRFPRPRRDFRRSSGARFGRHGGRRGCDPPQTGAARKDHPRDRCSAQRRLVFRPADLGRDRPRLCAQRACVRCGGALLSATVDVYVPYSGNAFLLNAIGATFIGTTLDPHGRPNVAGTLIGVLLLAVVANGLLFSGLNFYWQQVGTGLLIFFVLAASFGKQPGLPNDGPYAGLGQSERFTKTSPRSGRSHGADGHRFESPLLHHQVRQRSGGFRASKIIGRYSGFSAARASLRDRLAGICRPTRQIRLEVSMPRKSVS